MNRSAASGPGSTAPGAQRYLPGRFARKSEGNNSPIVRNFFLSGRSNENTSGKPEIHRGVHQSSIVPARGNAG